MGCTRVAQAGQRRYLGQLALLLVAEAFLALAAPGPTVIIVVVIVVPGSSGGGGVAVLGEDVVAVQRRTHARLLFRIRQRRRRCGSCVRGVRSGLGCVAARLALRVRRLRRLSLSLYRRGLCRCLRPRSRGLLVEFPLLLRRLRRLLGLHDRLRRGLGVCKRLFLPRLFQLELQLGFWLCRDRRWCGLGHGCR